MLGARNGAKLTGSGIHGRRHALLAVHHGRNPDAVLCSWHQICHGVQKTLRGVKAWLGGWPQGATPPPPTARDRGDPPEHPWGKQPSHRSAVAPCTAEELSLFKKPCGCLWTGNFDYSSSEISNFLKLLLRSAVIGGIKTEIVCLLAEMGMIK